MYRREFVTPTATRATRAPSRASPAPRNPTHRTVVPLPTISNRCVQDVFMQSLTSQSRYFRVPSVQGTWCPKNRVRVQEIGKQIDESKGDPGLMRGIIQW